MNITFCDKNIHVVEALSRAFHGHGNVRVILSDITTISADAIISPANSYGWMNGGVDQAYLYCFGQQLQCRLQQKIADKWDGFLPVGEALSIHAMGFGPRFPKYLISAPTMEIPKDVSQTENAYLAFKAALIEALRLGVESIVCPGLCTLTGRMDPDVMASQVRRAHNEILYTPKFQKSIPD